MHYEDMIMVNLWPKMYDTQPLIPMNFSVSVL